jgi:hypothetical protein
MQENNNIVSSQVQEGELDECTSKMCGSSMSSFFAAITEGCGTQCGGAIGGDSKPHSIHSADGSSRASPNNASSTDGTTNELVARDFPAGAAKTSRARRRGARPTPIETAPEV